MAASNSAARSQHNAVENKGKKKSPASSNIVNRLPDSVLIPPRSIWDPDVDDVYNIGGDTDTVSTGVSSRIARKHPSQMNELELRVQLWDSYRLARIILGVPIRSFHLKSQYILNSIRIVAEMKMELIRLQKELEMAILTAPERSHREEQDLLNSSMMKLEELVLEHQPDAQEQRQTQKEIYQTLQIEHQELVASTKQELESILSRVRRPGHNEADSSNRSSLLICNDKLEELIASLMEKVDRSSQETQQKLERLHASMEGTRREGRREELQQRAKLTVRIEELERKLKSRKARHALEMESQKAKFLQQISDMGGQLESYKMQVSRQHDEIQGWRRKYESLEALAVTPTQARDVMHAIENIHEDSTHEEQEEVQLQMMETLKQLTLLQAQQDRERSKLDSEFGAAQKKEEESEEELACLRIQMEILQEETEGWSAKDLNGQLAHQRAEYKQQISEILDREEGRLLEMEHLEVQLTDLAYFVVEMEDLNGSIECAKIEQDADLLELQTLESVTAKKLAAVKMHAQKLLAEQTVILKRLRNRNGELEENGITLNLDSRLGSMEEKADLQSELQEAREQLRRSEMRVRELESQLGKNDVHIIPDNGDVLETSS